MRIRLWGPVELVGPDGRMVALGSTKRRIALALLTLDLNRVVSGDRLIDAMWEGSPPPTAKAALQGHIAQLRKALGAGVELTTRSPGYQLLADRSQVDVMRFDDLLAEARNAPDEEAVELLKAALELRRGSVLADVPADRLWEAVVVQREEAEIAAVRQLAERLHRLDRVTEAVDLLRPVAERHPLRESLVELLVLGLHREGRQAEALGLYHRTRGLLVDELGVDPGAGLRQAYQTVLTDPGGPPAPSAPRRRPGQLPRENRVFVGREAEMAQLSRIRQDDSATRVLTGSAGVGKTALALRWAHRTAAEFPDGNLFVDLRGFAEAEPLAPEVALTGFLRAMGVPESAIPVDLDDRAALYRSMLAGRRMLIVLDDPFDAEQVRPLLPGTSGCVVLIASRNRLDDLVITEGAVAVPVGALPRSDAVDLLRLLVGADRLGDGWESELVDLCDRLPLALHIAAGRLKLNPQWTVEAFVAELRDENRRLDALSLPTAGTSIEVALATSYQQLSAESARAARLLGQHPGPDFDQHAAAALTGTTMRTVRGLLDGLTSVHLLHEAEPGRYGRPDLVRLHSTTLADATLDGVTPSSTTPSSATPSSATPPGDEYDTATARLLDYYLHTADLGRRLMAGIGWPPPVLVEHPPAEVPELRTPAAALAWFAKEETNLHKALQLANERGYLERTWRLAWCLETVHFQRGDLHEQLVVSSTGLSAARALGDAQAESLFHTSIGTILVRLGLAEEAIARCEQAIRLAGGQLNTESVALLALGHALYAADRVDEAHARLQEAIASAQSAGNVALQAYAVNAVAYLLRTRGDREGALRAARQSLELVMHRPESFVHTATLLTVGKTMYWLRRFEEALILLHWGLSLADDMGDLHHQTQFRRAIGFALSPAHDTIVARQEARSPLLSRISGSNAEQLRQILGSAPSQ